EGGRVTVVAADDSAHVLVNETDDRAAALQAIAGIEATQVPGNLTDAFALASALAARDPDSSVVVVTDANADPLPRVGIGATVDVRLVGTTDANQAVAALSAVRRSGGAQLDLFVAVSNPSSVETTRRLEIYADDVLVDARDLLLPAGQRTEALISSVPAGAALVEARLAGEDALAVDDHAFALMPERSAIRALLVSDGNTYLENALALLPRLELYAAVPIDYADALAEADDAGTPYGLVVFDRYVPAEAPDVPSLWIGPAEDGPYGALGATLNGPAVGRTDPDEALLRYIDLSTLHIGRARSVELADGMRPVVATPAGDPLVSAGRVDGRRMALLSFALAESDLPLQVAFPLLLSNLTDFLLPASGGVLPSSVELAEPLALQLDPGIAEVSLTDRAGAGGQAGTLSLDVVGGHVTLPGARVVGVRELREGGTLLGRTAANLFNPGESTVAPGDPMRIVDMGRVGPPPEGRDLSARNEWWWPLALAAFVLLAVEWLLFHRPTRRALARVLGRGSAGAAARSAPGGAAR
ncbi:MAG TPA: hypothetical protein VF013_10235, partial [Candidatus Limnocylindria bacterium]